MARMRLFFHFMCSNMLYSLAIVRAQRAVKPAHRKRHHVGKAQELLW